MKISVITLHTSINYGSVLQAYATQRVLEGLGHDVEFVDYCRKNNTEEARIKTTLSLPFSKRVSKVSCGLLDPLLKVLAKKRVRSRAIPMKLFIDKYLKVTKKKYFNFEELAKEPPIADVYVTGSDQVWNSLWNGGIDKAFFLEYAPEGKRKVSYASSIGHTDISDKEKKVYAEYLKKYSYVSVREDSCKELLSKIGVRSELVIDPTLMLRVEDWEKIAIKPSIKKPYLLVYQLNSNKKMESYANLLAKERGLKIVKIYKNRKFKSYFDAEISVVAPKVEELLGYFLNCAYVLTDSFHGTAFSINFSKPFICVAPYRFSDRIISILQLTHTENRMLCNYQDKTIISESITWDFVHEIIAREREKGYDFLMRAFE